jgi:hypothetical protein
MFLSRVSQLMADRAEELRVELAGLLARHEPMLSEDDRAQLVRVEEGYGWRPGRRPVRPEPKVAAFLDLFDRAEQEELTSHTLAPGTVEELRNAFRRGLTRS